jgi:hypothetical protein
VEDAVEDAERGAADGAASVAGSVGDAGCTEAEHEDVAVGVADAAVGEGVADRSVMVGMAGGCRAVSPRETAARRNLAEHTGEDTHEDAAAVPVVAAGECRVDVEVAA